MSKIHLEIFDKKRFLIFKKLISFAKIGYLGGGTALALQLRHRKSFDFDVFCPKPLTPILLKNCQEVFGSKLEILINNADQLTFSTSEKIAVTFLYYWFKPLEKPVSFPDERRGFLKYEAKPRTESPQETSIHPRHKSTGLSGTGVTSPFINLSPVLDIAVDKAHTIGRRAVWRDYVDVFYLLNNDFLSLSHIIKAAKKKFGSSFSETLFLEQLVYFEDINDLTISWIGKPIPTQEIEKFLRNEVKKYLEKI